jgi:hypothetical protein
MSFKIQFKYLNEARQNNKNQESYIAVLLAELGEARQRIRDLREVISNSRGSSKQERKDERARSTTFSRRNRFNSDEEWMREEIRRAWIGRYSPTDRLQFPLDDSTFRFGEEFFEFFKPELISEEQARKSVRTILDVVTGRQWTDSSRRGHAVSSILDKGHDDLGTMHRIYVEEQTPQALRLVLRKLKNSAGVELERVTKHDDF